MNIRDRIKNKLLEKYSDLIYYEIEKDGWVYVVIPGDISGYEDKLFHIEDLKLSPVETLYAKCVMCEVKYNL